MLSRRDCCGALSPSALSLYVFVNVRLFNTKRHMPKNWVICYYKSVACHIPFHGCGVNPAMAFMQFLLIVDLATNLPAVPFIDCTYLFVFFFLAVSTHCRQIVHLYLYTNFVQVSSSLTHFVFLRYPFSSFILLIIFEFNKIAFYYLSRLFFVIFYIIKSPAKC